MHTPGMGMVSNDPKVKDVVVAGLRLSHNPLDKQILVETKMI